MFVLWVMSAAVFLSVYRINVSRAIKHICDVCISENIFYSIQFVSFCPKITTE